MPITAIAGIVLTLHNIAATTNLDCQLDLKTIALHTRINPKVGSPNLTSMFECRTSSCSSLRSVLQQPSCGYVIPKSPHLFLPWVRYSAKSEDDSWLALSMYARIVQRLGFDAKFLERISWAAVMSSSPFTWRVLRTATDSLVVTRLRYVR